MVKIYMHIAICLCTLLINVSGDSWYSGSQDLIDDLYENEIYTSIVSSVGTWSKRTGRSRIKRDESSRVCYDKLGCFDNSFLGMLPGTPKEIDTKFTFFPRHLKQRSNHYQDFTFDEINNVTAWVKQEMNKSLPLKVISHGFGSDCEHVWVYEMRSSLMAVENVNVICVDWNKGAALPNYVKATANTRVVGKQLGVLLHKLIREASISPKNIHLIGFSLGAHVSGFAGTYLKQFNETVGRITGLDPAGPLFELQPPSQRLDPSDADFVDVIHSNGDQLLMGGFGTSQPLGHVDFFPNGGKNQTGCSNAIVGAVTGLFLAAPIESRSLCNHRRAYRFFIDSVSPRCHFPAFPCDSYEDYLAGKCFPCSEDRQCGNMGYYADRSKARGKLYLITREEEPFCAHQCQIKLESSPGKNPIITYGNVEVTLIGDSLLNETFRVTSKDDQELILGNPIAKIVVPHPILLEPIKIQVKYTAYTGWLTSGLTQWKFDKIKLVDSFGRSSSVCQKNLILDTGVPVILPLFPGDCNLPTDDSAEDRMGENAKNETSSSKFVPKPVKIESSKTTDRSLNEFDVAWSESNKIEEESRAFNTRIVKSSRPSKNSSEPIVVIEKEIVEPILKPHSSKIGRSHDPNKEKPEITEPILGPTTSKAKAYHFYDAEDNGEWVPAQPPTPKQEQKWKRQDDNKDDKKEEDKNIVSTLITTVRLFPARVAKMLHEAEEYARKNILPLVSTYTQYTPKFIIDFISPKEEVAPRYVPLSENTISKRKVKSAELIQETTTVAATTTEEDKTPYSNIQKIAKKETKVALVYPETTVLPTEGARSVELAVSSEKPSEKADVETTSQIYIDLPVFNASDKAIKYIPLEREVKDDKS